jgi:hypothetical protein
MCPPPFPLELHILRWGHLKNYYNKICDIIVLYEEVELLLRSIMPIEPSINPSSGILNAKGI